jgi:hypothetical protein
MKNRMRLLAAACLAAHVSQANHTQLISLFSREREMLISLISREREISWAGFLNTERVTLLLVYKQKT